MLVNCVVMATAPVGQVSNQLSYVVTDDGMIDDGNDVPANAYCPNGSGRINNNNSFYNY